MTRMTQFATAIALTLTLTACGGSGDEGEMDNTMMPPANGDSMFDDGTMASNDGMTPVGLDNGLGNGGEADNTMMPPANGDTMSDNSDVTTDDGGLPADDEAAPMTVLEKYRSYLGRGDSSDPWPNVGDYTHTFFYLLGEPIGDGLFAIAPTNISCQEESCWTSEASANSLGTVSGIQRVIEHANIPVYRFHGENAFAGLAYDTYGAWLEFTAFFVARACDIGGQCAVHGGFDTSIPSVAGHPSGSIPSGPGSSSWVGVVIAADTETHNLILGDAEVTIDGLNAVAPHVDVALTELWDVDAGIARADIRWEDLPIGNDEQTISVPGVDALPAGAFGRGYAPIGAAGGTAGGDYVIGQFFGHAHQEIAGSFVHSSTQTAGVFGGKRR